MENSFMAIFIFVIILFLYIHITSQWKTSNDIEIYEADYDSASQLQEVCSVKQPVVFKFQTDQVADSFFEKFQTAKFEKYDNLDVKVKDRNDYDKCEITNEKDPSVDYVPLSFRSTRRLLTTDTTAKYFSEKNHLFLEESGIDRLCASLDTHLKPQLSAYTKYDLLMGSPLVTTPLRYHLESHHFIATTRGKIRVKLCPPKYSKIIPTFMDYENYEFWSPLNPWTSQAKTKSEYKDILQKTKFLDIEVNSADILFVPPYWWYSISFSGDPETTVATFTYDVVMNVAAQSKHWGMYYLQQSNIKNRPTKSIRSLDGGEIYGEGDNKSTEYTSESIKNTDIIPQEREDNVQTSASPPAKREIVTNAGIYITGEK